MTPTAKRGLTGANLTRPGETRPTSPGPSDRRRRLGTNLARRVTDSADAGMATAEYALVTLAAAGFAGLLLAILKGPEVQALLLGIVTRALG